jgi:O-antigen/teichoic acid export membrane protein
MTRRLAPAGGAEVAVPNVGSDQPEEGRGVLANTFFGLLTQATTSIFTAALTLYLARALGVNGYGTFALALSVAVIAVAVSDLGLSHSVARYAAERRGDPDALREVVAAGLRLNLVAVLVSGAMLWALAGPIADGFGKPALGWPLRAIAISVIGQGMMLLGLRVFAAARRVDVSAVVVFFESLSETSASVALVALGAGVSGAAFGRAAGYAVGGVATVLAIRRLLGGRLLLRSLPSGASSRELVRYAAPLIVTNSAYTIYAVIDSILIGALLTTGAVGLFAAPLRLVTFVSYLGQAVTGAVAPRMARTPLREPDAAGLAASLRWLVMLQALLLAPIVVWAKPIVALLLGEGFHGSAEVLRGMALYIFLIGVSPLITVSVNFLGLAAQRIPIAVLSLGVNVVLDVLLLPAIGVMGAVIGTSTAYAIYVPAHFVICRRALGLRVRPLVGTAARAGLGACAMALVLVAIGTSRLSPAQWVLGLCAGTLAFALVLVGTGELKLGELQAVIATVRRGMVTR